MEAADVWKLYRRGNEQVVALQSVSLALSTGSFSFVVGPSGGGKSTLLHILGAMDRPTRGTVRLNGAPLDRASAGELAALRRRHIGFVFQFHNLLPALSAAENVALPLLANGVARREALRRAKTHLVQVGLEHRLSHKPEELSGGEQQRVALVRAIIAAPTLVLADEPTGELDAGSSKAVLDLMRDLNRRLGVTFLIATHDMRLPRPGEPVWRLENGRMVPAP
jgi:ABC-type lipoprotein export system ATPase subunit